MKRRLKRCCANVAAKFNTLSTTHILTHRHSVIMLNTLPLARYRFCFAVQTPLRLPEYAGSMLRGAFGNALRRTACMTREKDCKACPLYRSCPYPTIFETPPPETHTLQKFSQVPNAYVIEPPAWGERVYEIGEVLEFHMVLMGKALEQLPLIVFAWQRAFRHEVGHGTAELIDIHYCSQTGEQRIMHASEGTLQKHSPQWEVGNVGNVVRLNFETPLRLQDNGRAIPPAQLTARDLLMTLTRRISLLLELQMGLQSNFNFNHLLELASKTQFRHHLSWRDWTRFSSRQQQSMQLGGAIGYWEFESLAPEFGALLELGQWLHVGKNASFGLGKYTLQNEGIHTL